MMNASLNRTAASATLHCLTGCAIGEVSGMVIATALGWGIVSSIALAIGLAFFFGYALSMYAVMKHGIGFGTALKVALVADTASIAIMELADNGFILAVPGAIHANLDSLLFWVSLLTSLAVAFVVAFPLNRWMIARGKGHAIAHQYHHGHATRESHATSEQHEIHHHDHHSHN